MRAFFGSMTGRVFLTLLLGIVLSAALTQWLADAERQRVIEGYRDMHALEHALALDIGQPLGQRGRQQDPEQQGGEDAAGHRADEGFHAAGSTVTCPAST